MVFYIRRIFNKKKQLSLIKKCLFTFSNTNLDLVVDSNNKDINYIKAKEIAKFLKCPISNNDLEVDVENNIITLKADYIHYKFEDNILYLTKEHCDIKL